MTVAQNKYWLKPKLAERYGTTTRSIDRWRKARRFPEPDIELPNGWPAWSDTTVETHERACVANKATSDNT